MVIIGIGGATKDFLYDLLLVYKPEDLLFFTENPDDPSIPFFNSLEGIYVTTDINKVIDFFKTSSKHFIVTVADGKKREQLVDTFENLGGIPHFFISPLCSVSQTISKISTRNTIFMKFSSLGASSVVEDGSIFYAYTAMAHDCHIGKYTFLSAYSVGASCKIGDYSFIGLHAVILNGSEIGKNCTIGANSLVKTKVPDNCIAFGTPLKMKM